MRPMIMFGRGTEKQVMSQYLRNPVMRPNPKSMIWRGTGKIVIRKSLKDPNPMSILGRGTEKGKQVRSQLMTNPVTRANPVRLFGRHRKNLVMKKFLERANPVSILGKEKQVISNSLKNPVMQVVINGDFRWLLKE